MNDPAATTASLIVMGGPLAKRVFKFPPASSQVRVGSSPECEIHVPLPGVEPLHARIILEDVSAFVADGPSRGGVYVNDDRVTQRTAIRDTDILWLGAPGAPNSTMLQFRWARPLAVREESAPGVEEFFIQDETEAPTIVDRAPEIPVSEFFIDEGSAEAVYETSPPVAPKTDTQPIPIAAQDEFFIADTEAPGAVAEKDEFFVEQAPGESAEGAGHSAPTLVDASSEPISPPSTILQRPPEARPSSVAPVKPTVQPSGAPKPSAKPPARPPTPSAPKAAVIPRTAATGARPGGIPTKPRQDVPSARLMTPQVARRPTPAYARPRPRGRQGSSSSRLLVLLLVIAAGAGAGGFFIYRQLKMPKIETFSPETVRVGEKLTISGQNFPDNVGEVTVVFGSQAAAVSEVSSTRIVVVVPDLNLPPGKVNPVPIRVKTGSRSSATMVTAVYLPPRIHGLSPDVGMPGEEIVIAGAGWAGSVVVYFGDVTAEVTATETTFIRVRVPQIIVPQGTSIPVVVVVGSERSNAAPFLMGQLPLVTGVAPATASAGDIVRVDGRGFRASVSENVVKIGGVRALLLAASDDDIQFVVPNIDLAGQVPLEVAVAGRANSALGILGVNPSADPIPFNFVPEQFVDAAGHEYAVLVTGVGPTIVLASSGKSSAAQRAVAAAQRLNAAAELLRATRDVDIEIVDLESAPRLQLTGSSDPLIEITAEDITAYSQDWTNLRGKGGLVTAGRLATWWRALLRDLVLLLIRGESPRYTAEISVEGRILLELYEDALRTRSFGVTRSVVAGMKPVQRERLRLLAFRVPPTVSVSEAVERAAAGASTSAISTTALPLDRPWKGREIVDGRSHAIEVSFEGQAGTLTYTGGVTLSVPILDVKQPRPDSISFTAEAGGGVRYYEGKWNGQMIRGTVSSRPSGAGDLGSFELSW